MARLDGKTAFITGGGSVINMASNVALMGFPGRDAYTAAKGGIAAITRSLAVSYAPQKVRVKPSLRRSRSRRA